MYSQAIIDPVLELCRAVRAQGGRAVLVGGWVPVEGILKRLPLPKLTGDALADLEGLLRLFFSNVGIPTIGKTLRGLIAEAQLDPEFRAKFFAVFVSTRRGLMRDVLLKGVADGKLRAELDVEIALDLLYGGFWYRLLSGTADPLDEAFARSLVMALRPWLVPQAR